MFRRFRENRLQLKRHEICAIRLCENREGEATKVTFESIESAHSYVGLLREAVEETAQLIEQEMTMPLESNGSRHLDALRLVHYKLRSLDEHLIVSRRLLGDLRMLRRHLFNERASDEAMNEVAIDESSHVRDQMVERI